MFFFEIWSRIALKLGKWVENIQIEVILVWVYFILLEISLVWGGLTKIVSVQSIRGLKKLASGINGKDLIIVVIGTLIQVFIGLLVSWVVMVTPHVAFQDYVMKGRMFSVGTLMEGQYQQFNLQYGYTQQVYISGKDSNECGKFLLDFR